MVLKTLNIKWQKNNDLCKTGNKQGEPYNCPSSPALRKITSHGAKKGSPEEPLS